MYEGRSKSSRKSAIIFLFWKSAELNYYSYIDKHDLYLYSKFCCSCMNTMLTVVAMETVHHDYRSMFVHFCKRSMFNDGVAFDSYPCFLHQTLYEQSSYVCGEHMASYKCVTSFGRKATILFSRYAYIAKGTKVFDKLCVWNEL